MYAATAKAQKLDTRLFVRTLVLRRPALTEEEGVAALTELSAQELAASINTLEQAIGDSRYKRTESNHLFFRWLSPLCLSVEALERLCGSIVKAEHANLLKLQASRARRTGPCCVDTACPGAAQALLPARAAPCTLRCSAHCALRTAHIPCVDTLPVRITGDRARDDVAALGAWQD